VACYFQSMLYPCALNPQSSAPNDVMRHPGSKLCKADHVELVQLMTRLARRLAS
jgi:hypothetical protein